MSLDHTTALQAYNKVSQTRLTDLRNALLKAAVRYAAIRAEWHFMSATERATADPGRTIAHNRFIDTCNILSREQAKIGEDNKWREAIGMERKLIGDWACYVSCFIGIGNR
jgi:hypothetical protein